ncbi:MAG: hypothetical protein U1F59_00305 [Candidatus Competibacteraceae bacterium]
MLVQHVPFGRRPARIDAERAQLLVLAGDVEPTIMSLERHPGR